MGVFKNLRNRIAGLLAFLSIGGALTGCSDQEQIEEPAIAKTEIVETFEETDETGTKKDDVQEIDREAVEFINSLKEQASTGKLVLDESANKYIKDIEVYENRIKLKLYGNFGDDELASKDLEFAFNDLRMENLTLHSLKVLKDNDSESKSSIFNNLLNAFKNVKVEDEFIAANCTEPEIRNIDASKCESIWLRGYHMPFHYAHDYDDWVDNNITHNKDAKTIILTDLSCQYYDNHTMGVAVYGGDKLENLIITVADDRIIDGIWFKEKPSALRIGAFGSGTRMKDLADLSDSVLEVYSTGIENPQNYSSIDDLLESIGRQSEVGKTILDDISGLCNQKLKTFDITPYRYCTTEQILEVLKTNPIEEISGENIFVATSELIEYLNAKGIKYPENLKSQAEEHDRILNEININESMSDNEKIQTVLNYWFKNNITDHFSISNEYKMQDDIITYLLLSGLRCYSYSR